MLNKLKKSNNKGFTIIEVMIVLAIAGLIILIVLLAVPALQRNGRNTAIKNDASAVTAGIAEFQSNNDGIGPTTVTSAVGGTVTLASTVAGTAPTSAKVQGGTTVNNAGNVTPPIGTISVRVAFRCDGTANARAYAIWYSIENSSATPQYKCIDG